MDLGLKNKVALVAAGSRGLGRAIAEELAAEGASLILCARDAATLADTTATIADVTGAHVLGVPADVTDVEQVKNLVASGTSTSAASTSSSPMPVVHQPAVSIS